ncbi:MAG: glycosyltransferase family 2 protein [Candidatus Saccharimonadales bacterium]|jgi:dolichol-phosphate mannosyltransferase
MKRALVILPTYNEADNIQPIVAEIFKVSEKMSSWRLSVMVADDNSPDGTAKLVKLSQKQFKDLYLISGQRAGLGKAYIRGFKYGLKHGPYDAFVMMDADFSHDPAAIPTLLAGIDKGSDYVIGSRYVSGSQITKNWSKTNLISSRIANIIARIFIDIKDVADLTGGFRAVRRSALEKINLQGIHAGGNVFLVNLLHEFSRNGFAISEVPVNFGDRRYGKSKRRVRDVIEFLYITYRLNPNSRARRMIRFGLVGFSGTIVNLLVIYCLVHLLRQIVLLSDAVAIEVSIISNFFMNHYYTFRAAFTSPRSSRQESARSILIKLGKYNLIALGGAAISFVIFATGFKVLGINYILADLIAIVLSLSWNYWMSIHIVWKVVDT